MDKVILPLWKKSLLYSFPDYAVRAQSVHGFFDPSSFYRNSLPCHLPFAYTLPKRNPYHVPGLFADFSADFLADAENVAGVPHFDDASFVGLAIKGGRHRHPAFPKVFLTSKGIST